jgi:hypothetical protein
MTIRSVNGKPMAVAPYGGFLAPPLHTSHVINPREAHPDEWEDDTWTSHGLKGPWGPKPTHFLHPPRRHPRAHVPATWPMGRASRAHKGSAKPWVRPNHLKAGWYPPSTWWFLIGPRVDFQVVWGALTPVHEPINRRRGGSFLSNLTCNTSLTFGFQG